MEKILVQIKGNIIYFKRRVNLKKDQKDLLNTNVIADNELVFSNDYIRENQKIIVPFIKQLTKNSNVDTVYIYKNDVALELLEIVRDVNFFKHLVIKDDFLITAGMCDVIKNSKSIETVSVYSLHDFLTELLDKFGKIVEVRKEIFLFSNFASGNELTKFSSMLYKRSVNLTFPFSDEDKIDFEMFISINKYLKTIHINKCIKSDLEDIINLILKENKSDIKIMLHENVFEESLVEYIKKINATYKKNEELKIVVSYTDSYLKKNFLPQTNINILKASIVLVIILVCGTYTYFIFYNYIDYNNDVALKEIITETILNTDTEVIIKDIEAESEKKVVNEYIASLTTINPEIIAWINVPGTSVDYPIVLGDDNDKYLVNDFEDKYSRVGAIFMNYKNNGSFLEDNTIIFGHNFVGSSVMFSSLSKIDTETWQNEPSNRIITVDTLFETLQYEIFSYYKSDIITDYLITNYSNTLQKFDEFSKFKNRSEFDFGITIDNNSQIITLSTCADNGTKRFVVHAKLIEN